MEVPRKFDYLTTYLPRYCRLYQYLLSLRATRLNWSCHVWPRCVIGIDVVILSAPSLCIPSTMGLLRTLNPSFNT